MKKNSFWLLGLVFPLSAFAASDLCINEVMQSNIDCLMEDNDYPDSWVELYNPTENDINCHHYYLRLGTDNSDLWRIDAPMAVVPAGGHIVIFCDKENTGLHAPFRLDSGMSDIYLFDASGHKIDTLSLKKMPAPNIAYGRVTDGAENWQYEMTPTPGTANMGNGAKKVLPDPIFSVQGGVMNAPVQVVISMPESDDVPTDAKIYITLNGSEPTCESMSSDTTFTFDISTTTVIRAKLLSEEALPTRSVAQSYIYHLRQTKMPIISILTDSANLYSEEYGILMGKETDPMPNYKQDWHRPVNTEYFDADGNTVFNQLGETAIGGNYTKDLPQKSLKLYANKRFGTKRYEGAFWQDKPNVTSVKSFMLRNGGNNCQYARINDATIQTVFGTHVESLDWQAYQPVIVYINGQYKGEFGMREHSDEDYVESNYNGLEDIWQADAAVYYSTSAAFRKQFHFTDLYNTYMKQGVTYDELAQKMDMPNFMDALIAEMFAANIDYPHMNVSMWRPQEDGGKWRWILKDMDYMALVTNQSYNMFDYMFRYTSEVSGYSDKNARCHEIYTNVIAIPQCRDMFIDRFATYLGDFLKPSVTLPLVDSMAAEIRDELPYTYAAYDNMSDMEKFNQWLNTLTSFYTDRPMIVYDQMAKYFSLGRVFPMQIAAAGNAVQMNGVSLTEGDFDGAYFENRTLHLSSETENRVWKMTISHSNQTITDSIFSSADISVNLGDYVLSNNDNLSVHFELVNPDVPTLQMLSFSLTDGSSVYNAYHIDDVYIDIQVPELTDLSSMTAVFTHSGQSVSVNGIPQTSGVDSHDFSDFVHPLQYVITGEEGEEKTYTVRLFNLPIIFVQTENAQEIVSKEDWLACSFVIQSTDGTRTDYDTTNIRGRGNTSWSLQDKKPYTIKLGKKQEVFGMPKHKRWQLLTTYGNSASFLRDDFMFEMARRTASLGWAPHGAFAELFVNGQHRGLYWLCEKISVDKNRVNIKELDPEDIDSSKVSGGYLMEYAAREAPQFYSETFNFNYCLKDPDEDVPSEQFNYIQDYINDMEECLMDSARFYRHEYENWLDVDSWIDYWFLHEMADGTDIKLPNFAGLSCFCYKDRGGKLKAGPVWDMHFYAKGTYEYHAKDALYYIRLFDDPKFVKRVQEKWYGSDTVPGFETLMGDILTRVDSIAPLIQQSGDRDLAMWGKNDSIAQQAQLVKRRYTNNINWMNYQIQRLEIPDYPDTSIPLIDIPNSPTVTDIFTVSGIQAKALQPGINFIRYSDGTIKKQFYK